MNLVVGEWVRYTRRDEDDTQLGLVLSVDDDYAVVIFSGEAPIEVPTLHLRGTNIVTPLPVPYPWHEGTWN